MPDFAQFVAPTADVTDPERLIEQACAYLSVSLPPLTTVDLESMDRELHFRHIMFSGSDRLVWNRPGSHPRDFFEQLLASKWRKTTYVSRLPVLVSVNKVHFVVTYARSDQASNVISRHTNVWIATRIQERWGIALRSY